MGFITLHSHAVESLVGSQQQPGDERGTQQIQLVFDRGTYTGISKDIHPGNIGRDFTGWVSAYNGRPLDQVEMNEWLDNIIETVLNCDSSHSLDVLELGTGSGMILFSIAKNLHYYLGLTAVDFVTATARSTPELASKVQVHQGTATDFHFLGSCSPKVVVISSVAQ